MAIKLAKGKYFFFSSSFSLDEKEAKNQGKKMLPRSRPGLARSR